MGSDFDQSLRYEEQFHSTQDRKFFKKERKEASLKDRSKYKKSDQKNQEKPSYKPPSDQEKEGKVLAIYPEAILVDSEGVLYQCQLKALSKKKNTKQKTWSP